MRARSRSGGTGRRAGLKIRWGASSVWVRLPPSAHTESEASRECVLTGGGDCPGLNAVIRAVARRSHAAAARSSASARAGAGSSTAVRAARAARDLGDPAARRDDHRHLADEPVQGRRRRRHGARELRARAPRRARRDRRRGHARRRGAAVRGARLPGRRRPEDDRQRPLRDRLHVRLRHGGLDLHRGDRPAAHDGGVAQPRHGRRGHGPPHRLDRGHERHRRRRGRDPHPRAADHGRGGVRGDHSSRHERGKDFSIVVVSEGYELTYASGEQRQVTQEADHDEFGHVRFGGVGAGARRRRSRSAPATRRASRCSATSSAAARRRRATACSRRASA